MRALLLIVFIVATLSVSADEPVRVSGRLHPERQDDLAWENDLVAFRAYGPGTSQRGERAYGYDIFFKYPHTQPILDSLYALQTNPANMARLDSLRNVDRRQAEAYERSISYHIDHGRGMDCYAVGPTLGCGATALMVNDSIIYPWAFEYANVVDRGPERFVAELVYSATSVGIDTLVERRVITLIPGTYLNRCDVTYAGQTSSLTVLIGIPLRDNSPAFGNPGRGIMAYADPTQGPDNGKALTGVVIPCGAERMFERDGHIMAVLTLQPGQTLTYYWGYAWSRGEINDMRMWLQWLGSFKPEPA